MQDSQSTSRYQLHRIVVLLVTAVVIADPCIAQNSGVPSDAERGINRSDPVERAQPLGHWPPAFIFFPPLPPPLDEPVSRVLALSTPTPPGELSAYVNEIFYAPLSTLLLKNELSPKMRQRLDAYRVARDNLRTELLHEIARLHSADAITRRHALEALAQQQASRLAALEETAESLRLDLVDGHYGWFVQRDWHLGQRGQPDSLNEVEAVMKAYAYFHKGLSPEVRGLLREIATEFAGTQSHFFFSPATARVQLPADLPAPLAARLAEYQTKKSVLKKELYDATLNQERAGFWRGNTLKDWEATKAARLAELDELAEQIRRDLAPLPHPVKPSSPAAPLPPGLIGRIASLRRSRDALQAHTLARITEIELQIPTAWSRSSPLAVLTYAFDATGLTFDVRPSGVAAPGSILNPGVRHGVEKTRRAMAAVAEAYGRDFAAIASGMIALRGDIARTLGRPGDPPPEAALAATIRYLDSQESSAGYREYRTAVFEPGLSPAQRRLLLGNAIEELRLPLPPAELQPTVRKP